MELDILISLKYKKNTRIHSISWGRNAGASCTIPFIKASYHYNFPFNYKKYEPLKYLHGLVEKFKIAPLVLSNIIHVQVLIFDGT